MPRSSASHNVPWHSGQVNTDTLPGRSFVKRNIGRGEIGLDRPDVRPLDRRTRAALLVRQPCDQDTDLADGRRRVIDRHEGSRALRGMLDAKASSGSWTIATPPASFTAASPAVPSSAERTGQNDARR